MSFSKPLHSQLRVQPLRVNGDVLECVECEKWPSRTDKDMCNLPTTMQQRLSISLRQSDRKFAKAMEACLHELFPTHGGTCEFNVMVAWLARFTDKYLIGNCYGFAPRNYKLGLIGKLNCLV